MNNKYINVQSTFFVFMVMYGSFVGIRYFNQIDTQLLTNCDMFYTIDAMGCATYSSVHKTCSNKINQEVACERVSKIVVYGRYKSKGLLDGEIYSSSLDDRVAIESTISQLLERDFDAMLNNFKKNRVLSQLATQQVINLLDVELEIVQALLANHTGAIMQNLLEERNNLINTSIPVAVDMYDVIIALATVNNTYNEQIKMNNRKGKKLLKTLNTFDKKEFLSIVEESMQRYQDIMRKVQNQVSERLIACR
jgi:hypothetical protein